MHRSYEFKSCPSCLSPQDNVCTLAQSGAWTAIGFPVESADARHTFYTFANWVYQIGVFLSRSSGLLYQVGPTLLLCHCMAFAETHAGQHEAFHYA